MGLTVYSQTPVAVGCVHPTTRLRAWSAVEQSPRHPHESPASRENSSTTLADGPKHDATGAEAKQALLWKGWVLKQWLNDDQSRVGATATQAHVESPLRTELFVDSCSVKTSGQLLCEHLRNPRHLDLHARTKHREMFMQQDCCARTPQAHLDLSPCAKRHVPAKRLLHSHATSTLGSLSVRKQQDVVMGQTAAFSRHTHTWISLRAQTDIVMRQTAAFAQRDV